MAGVDDPSKFVCWIHLSLHIPLGGIYSLLHPEHVHNLAGSAILILLSAQRQPVFYWIQLVSPMITFVFVDILKDNGIY